MASEKDTIKNDECNSTLLTAEKKAKKRRLVKKFSNEKSTPDDISSPLSTSKPKTPNSLKPKGKIMKKSSQENSKLGESSSPLSPSDKRKGKNGNKSSDDKPMSSNLKDVQESQKLKVSEKKVKPSNHKETQNSQNHKPEIPKKGFHSGKGKKAKSSSMVHGRNEDMKKLGGFIFMCNGKTKQDCYRFRVMGVQAHKKELVMGVKPGMKLFLFDFDVKLLYGIYTASSAGGMKLEPAAFGGAFPLQVRFEVYKDCLPLPESVFKKAIKESYDERTRKFKMELTIDQVKKLTYLFKPAPLLHTNPQSVVHEPRRPSKASPPLLLTEQEYRSYGLRGDRHKNLTPTGQPTHEPYRTSQDQNGLHFSNPTMSSSLLLTEHDYRSHGLRGERHENLTAGHPPAHDPYRTNQELNGLHPDAIYLPRPSEPEPMQFPNPTMGSSPLLLTEHEYRSHGLRGERHNNLTPVRPPAHEPYRPDQERDSHPATLFLSERDYRTYGLKGRQENPASTAPTMDPISTYPASKFYQPDPHGSFSQNPSVVDRYLPQPLAGPSGLYGYETNHEEKDRQFHNEPVLSDRVERLNSLAEYNRTGGGEVEYRSAPVSARYAFAGPSVIYR